MNGYGVNPVSVLAVSLISGMFSLQAYCAEAIPTHQSNNHDVLRSATFVSYYIEISISNNRLTLYEKTGDAVLTPIANYTIGTAVKGLTTYPVGLGTVTGVYFNPWWYPTPYSRQVFRARGIELPAAVPPGHPLNYMGPFKIALSHRTKKGAVYRIHGNNDPKRVGRRVTGGCFVMDNSDGLALAHRIKVGTEVRIVP